MMPPCVRTRRRSSGSAARFWGCSSCPWAAGRASRARCSGPPRRAWTTPASSMQRSQGAGPPTLMTALPRVLSDHHKGLRSPTRQTLTCGQLCLRLPVPARSPPTPCVRHVACTSASVPCASRPLCERFPLRGSRLGAGARRARGAARAGCSSRHMWRLECESETTIYLQNKRGMRDENICLCRRPYGMRIST